MVSVVECTGLWEGGLGKKKKKKKSERLYFWDSPQFQLWSFWISQQPNAIYNIIAAFFHHNNN